MFSKRIPASSALLAAAALAAVPALATAHDASSVRSVKTHIAKSGRALERSVYLFEHNNDRRAQRLFAARDQQLALAEREARQLRQDARNDTQRDRAVQAEAVVATARDSHIDQVVGVLDEASGRAEQQLARSVLADTRARAKAVEVLDGLVARGVSSRAAARAASALSELAQGRDDELRGEVQALASKQVANASKRLVAHSLKANVATQQAAADKLAELIASPEMPDASKRGLQVAYDAVIKEQRDGAEVLAAFADRIPAAYRAYVQRTEQDARENSTELEQQRGDWQNPQTDSGSGSGSGTGGGAGTGSGTYTGTGGGAGTGSGTYTGTGGGAGTGSGTYTGTGGDSSSPTTQPTAAGTTGSF